MVIHDPNVMSITLDPFEDHSRCSCGRRHWHGGGGEGLVEIGNDVVDVLDADRKADIAGRHAAGQLIGRTELRVRGAGRMDGQRSRIAYVRHVIEELERVNEARAGLNTLLELEADETAKAA